MKRAMAISAGVMGFVAYASAQSGEYWTDPATGERVGILESRPIHVVPTHDRFMMIGQTATDAVSPAFLGEIRVVNVRCHATLVPGGYQYERFLQFRSVIGSGGVAVVGNRQGEEIRIKLKTMTYYVMRKKLRPDEMPYERVTEIGVCSENLPQLPAPAPVRQSADTTNAPRAEIKVVAAETDAHPAVVTVSGSFRQGDNLRFFDAINKTSKATVYLDSPGGNTFAGIGIGEIIHERNFHTAVINYGRCLSACAIAWLGGTKRYLGGFAEVGFHHPSFGMDIGLDEATTARAMAYALRIISSYVVSTLDLSKDTAEYVTVMFPTNPKSVNYLTPEDGERYGIAFTRTNIPGYIPLP